MTYRQWFPIKPRVKGRPRFSRGRTYTPKETLEYERALAEMYDGPVFDGPIEMDIEVHSNGLWVALRPSELRRPKGIRGDVDNYGKAVGDALQKGVAYENDRDIMCQAIRFGT